MARKPSNEPILIIFDGHGSHYTDDILEEAIKNNIRLLRLPSHTTHKLQSLDVGFFKHIQ